jgi:peptidylprolyl isomerase
MAAAKKGDTVKVHYIGTLADGTTFDSSAGHDPLTFQIGSGQVIEGFEEAVLGMSVGESKTVVIPVNKAYGAHNAEMVIEAPREHIPPDMELEVGQMLEMGGPGGELVRVVVTAVSPTHVTLDANPPLAGMDLTFQLDLVAIG